MKNCFLLACFLILKITGFAQHLSGFIYGANNEALVAVTIRDIATNRATITDGKGYFELNTNSLDDKISVEYIGYNTKLTYAKDIKVNDTIYLSPVANNLKDVVVSNLDKYSLVKRIIYLTKSALPKYCIYNYYFKDFLKIAGKIKYYSDALAETDINENNDKAYLFASRSLRKIDSTDEKILGKIKMMDNMKKNFSNAALINFYDLKNENSDNLKNNYQLSVEDFSDSLLKITFIPNDKIAGKKMLSTTWYVNKQDSIIREIQLKLLPSQKGKVAFSNLICKQYYLSNDEIFRYEMKDGQLFLNSVYLASNKNITPRLLASFKPFDYRMEALILVTNASVSDKEIPESKTKKEYHWYDTLQSFGKNYTTPFWENIQSIQQTQDEIDFFK